MNNEKAIDIFNKLIQLTNDRIKGYQTASKETEEEELQDIFGYFLMTSLQCKDELANEVISLRGTPAGDTRTTAKFFRVWMDVKAALRGKNKKAIINSCEYEDDMVKDMYKEALEDAEHLTADQLSIIEGQLLRLKENQDAVREMKDMLA